MGILRYEGKAGHESMEEERELHYGGERNEALKMGRVRENISIGRKPLWTLFDSGAENTYVVETVGLALNPKKLRKPRRARLGGKLHRITRKCDLVARVDGQLVEVEAYLIKRIGRDSKTRRDFEVLFGARAMQDWGIELDMKNEQLDLSGYPGEFVEFREF